MVNPREVAGNAEDEEGVIEQCSDKGPLGIINLPSFWQDC